ncbi:MAG: 4-aminobutyrate--2-oxoglutarate transaminase [Acidobacteria bacterium]|nr:4-aminobutyrate--2-oxoglutarate transaminase [Acidobacteriota bacterium]
MISQIRLVTDIPGPKSREHFAKLDAQTPRGLSRITRVFIERAEGAFVEDVDGNRYLDFAGGIGCVNTGHRPAEVVEASAAQLNRFLHNCFMVTPYESYLRLAEILNQHTPGDFAKKTFFVNSGAEAVENAIKIARSYTGRPGVIAFEDGFHGRTLLALTLTSKTSYKTGFAPFAPEVYRIPYAYCYRCSYNLTYPDCRLYCANQLEDVFIRYVEAESIAAVIFEPVPGEGGFIVPPRDFLERITEICRRRGILIIADEVQTGFARTGTMFACEQFGIEPDLIVTGKSIAAGLPLAGITGRAEIMDAPASGALGGTFGGNPVACEAAIAAWELLTKLDLPGRAREIGQLFKAYTRDWPERIPLIGEVRGLGAMCAIELVRDRASREPAKDETLAILHACLQRGLILISAGTYGNVIRFHLPLVATDEQIKVGLNILEEVFEENA